MEDFNLVGDSVSKMANSPVFTDRCTSKATPRTNSSTISSKICFETFSTSELLNPEVFLRFELRLSMIYFYFGLRAVYLVITLKSASKFGVKSIKNQKNQ